MIEYEAIEDVPEPAHGPEPGEAGATDPVPPQVLAPNYNVTPTTSVTIIATRVRDGRRVLRTARWGLLPPWAPDERTGARFINARAETVAVLPAFRTSFARRRCLVPADGWFEWRSDPDGAGRQVFFVTPEADAGLSLAGVWTVWSGPAGPLISCSIVTTEAVGDLRAVHDRMPLILPAARHAAWLDPGTSDPSALLSGPPRVVLEALEIRRVGPAVGNVRAAGPELVKSYVPAAAAPTLF